MNALGTVNLHIKVYATEGMTLTSFGDLLTFPLVPPAG